MKLWFVFLLLVMGAENLWASELTTENNWKSNLELGYVQTGGNTQVRTLNTKAKVQHDGESLRSTLQGTALSTTDKDITTAEKYTASLQEDWKFSQYDYVFLHIGFDTDRFGGFKRRLSEALGYGRDLIKDDTFDWNIEIGAGGRQTTLTTNKKSSEVIGRAATAFHWHVSDSALFIQELKTEGGKKGFVSNSLTALQNKISGHLSSKISYALQNTSKVPVGKKKNDTEISIALVWSY